jgi:hypothetical protein
MTTPIFARKDPNNTVNVLDGAFNADGKFVLLVEDAAAGALLQMIADSTATAAGKNYSYGFGWTSGNLTSVTRTADGTSQQAVFSYDGNNNLTGITAWA